MNRSALLASAVAGIAALTALPVAAQINEVAPPRIVKLGMPSAAVAGRGAVRVQVLVNPDGSHVVMRIISSTNHGDDQAAREIAQRSRYRPARRGMHRIKWLYDPTFRFTGPSPGVAPRARIPAPVMPSPPAPSATPADPPADPPRADPPRADPLPKMSRSQAAEERVDALIRTGQYDTAKAVAQSALASNPNDPALEDLLGVAEYYSHDYTDAASAFYHAGTVPRIYQNVAAQSFASAAVQIADTDAAQAMEYAQRAYETDHSANSKYAIGVAQLAEKQYGPAIATLDSVRSELAASHGDVQTRYDIDQHLLQAYMEAGTLDRAQPVIDDMHRLQPSNGFPEQQMAAYYINAGNGDLTVKNYGAAETAFDKAASYNDPKYTIMALDGAANAVASGTSPDPVKLKGYADKALATNSNDLLGNFFEGYAYALQYGKSHDLHSKQQALTYLGKANDLAKAAGNTSVAQNAQNLITQLDKTGAGQSMP